MIEEPTDPVMPTAAPTLGLDALREMRTSRRKNRLLEMEWFDAMYRVYLAAFIGGGLVLFLSGLIKDEKLDAAGVAEFTARTPQVLGLVVIGALFLGLRSGANGGPVAVEDADVRHVLLAPISRAAVLRHPVIQRLRTTCFTGILAGAIAGQLVVRRLPGTPISWVVYGACFGALVGVLFVSTALVAHALRFPYWATSLLGGGLLIWQTWAALGTQTRHGPANSISRISIWALGVHAIDLVGVVVIILITVSSIAVVGKLSLEALARRANLVAQLKFAVTLQDIRTVVLLRRQLSQESMRTRPWWTIAHTGRLPVVPRRGLHSFTRFPMRRITRMMLLTAGAAVAQVYAYRGTAPAIVISGLLLFVLGLEAIEPLSQEVDQPERSESFPIPRGQIMRQHLIVPALILIPFAALGGVIAAVLQRETSGAAAVVAILALPTVWGGAAGAVINAVKGAPDPIGQSAERLYMPPEVSGMTTMIRSVWPPVVSILASLPILLVRSAEENDYVVLAAAVRGAIGCLLMIVLVVGWVHQRDAIHRWWNQVLEGGRMAQSDRPSSEGGLI